MKRKVLLLFSLTFTLTSCGTNTMGWPTIDFPFSSNQISSITMNYVHKEKNEDLFDTIVITEPSQIKEVYSFIHVFPYKEKIEKTIETEKYHIKLSFDFKLINYESSFYHLIYYEYRIADGKIIFDNGEVHWLPGNFAIIYERYVNKYNKKEST